MLGAIRVEASLIGMQTDDATDGEQWLLGYMHGLFCSHLGWEFASMRIWRQGGQGTGAAVCACMSATAQIQE